MLAPVPGSETTRRDPADATETSDGEMDRILEVGNKAAVVAGEVLRKYFRQRFDIIDKEDLSSVTIADREAEESMVSIILESFPSHAVFGEENGWRCEEDSADYVWVLYPIDGTKSFITMNKYTTSPHLFGGDAEEAFIRVRNKVKVPLYGCDCYAYALLASGFVDLVIESALKPYDVLSLVPVA